MNATLAIQRTIPLLVPYVPEWVARFDGAGPQAVAEFQKLKTPVTQEMLVEKYGARAEWTSRTIAAMRGDFRE